MRFKVIVQQRVASDPDCNGQTRNEWWLVTTNGNPVGHRLILPESDSQTKAKSKAKLQVATPSPVPFRLTKAEADRAAFEWNLYLANRR